MKKAVAMILSSAILIVASGCSALDQVKEPIEYAYPVDEAIYYQTMDKILGQYNFNGLEWGSKVNLTEGTDALIFWDEDETGRYKAYGVISMDAGCYGIILDDTIDGTDDNANYVYEEWAYTGKAEDKPKFKWDGNQLYLTYPVSEDGEVTKKTVEIGHGFDTGHMEFRD
ncbi:hypothetical protein D6855_06390 [Butyrivibrio sp. CB08]|uniref:hypothetical protein n=1 Tax=Butyrivibrio sp. CB08 TaxID=2364879 RepID=UPI000EA8E379|nr:hypothetical protein [Butyrivibrio sp. CB08]RKM60350.1 hypothetical protein D6855_06390 [Butyrivibrio sp. CB08]